MNIIPEEVRQRQRTIIVYFLMYWFLDVWILQQKSQPQQVHEWYHWKYFFSYIQGLSQKMLIWAGKFLIDFLVIESYKAFPINTDSTVLRYNLFFIKHHIEWTGGNPHFSGRYIILQKQSRKKISHNSEMTYSRHPIYQLGSPFIEFIQQQ